MKILMVKGTSLIPQRFWSYVYATSEKQKASLEREGYARSNQK